MNLNSMTAAMSSMMHKTSFTIRRHSPEILLIAGISGGIASAVLACKATIKAQTILEDTKKAIEDVHKCEEMPNDVYTQEDAKKDLTKVYIQTGVGLTKEYWPAVTLGAASIACIMVSHNVMGKRNASLAAAYATISQSFGGYRKRVAERYGEEVERQIRYNIKAQEIKESVIDEETGKKKTVKKTVETCEMEEGYCDYARPFRNGCKGWEPNPKYSRLFLQGQQELANQMLRAYGYLFLNDVYDLLGITKTAAGQAVGWIYDPKAPTGDNYVDFRIQEFKDTDGSAAYLLDFNVDGAIIDGTMKRGLMAM